MGAREKPVSKKEKVSEASKSSHEVNPKVLTAEGWNRLVLKDIKGKKRKS